MILHIKIIGFLLILLSMIHVIFPKYFNWEEELSRISLINKQMMEIHTLFIGITVFMMGLLCVVSTHDLVSTSLGRTISLGFGIFWAIRFFIQIFGYSSKLWKGKQFETIVHILFSALWIYLSVVFILNYIN